VRLVTATATHAPAEDDALPRWSVADIFPALDSREFQAALEQAHADAARAAATLDRHEIRAIEPRRASERDGRAADEAIGAINRLGALLARLSSFVFATVSTDSRDEAAQALLAELEGIEARLAPLVARLADWISAIHAGSDGPAALAAHSDAAAEHGGPLLRLAARSAHQMSEVEENLYAELATVGSTSWKRLQRDLTSQLTAAVPLADGVRRLPMPAVRGLANDADPSVRRAAFAAELETPGHRSLLPVPRRSTRSRARRRSSTGGASGITRSTPRCSPTPSAGARSTRCRPLSWTHCPTFGAGCGPNTGSTAVIPTAGCRGGTSSPRRRSLRRH
jgi:hypothetical protein